MSQRITFAPLGARREQAIAKINSHFASITLGNFHREQEWSRKRAVATAVRQEGEKAATSEFVAEASLRQISTVEFADLVLSKADPVDARALARQQAIFSAEGASTLEALSLILEQLPQE